MKVKLEQVSKLWLSSVTQILLSSRSVSTWAPPRILWPKVNKNVTGSKVISEISDMMLIIDCCLILHKNKFFLGSGNLLFCRLKLIVYQCVQRTFCQQTKNVSRIQFYFWGFTIGWSSGSFLSWQIMQQNQVNATQVINAKLINTIKKYAVQKICEGSILHFFWNNN